MKVANQLYLGDSGGALVVNSSAPMSDRAPLGRPSASKCKLHNWVWLGLAFCRRGRGREESRSIAVTSSRGALAQGQREERWLLTG